MEDRVLLPQGGGSLVGGPSTVEAQGVQLPQLPVLLSLTCLA